MVAESRAVFRREEFVGLVKVDTRNRTVTAERDQFKRFHAALLSGFQRLTPGIRQKRTETLSFGARLGTKAFAQLVIE